MPVDKYEYTLSTCNPSMSKPVSNLTLLLSKPYTFHKTTSPVLYHGGVLVRG